MQAVSPGRQGPLSAQRTEIAAGAGMLIVGAGAALSPAYTVAFLGVPILLYLLSRGPWTRAAVVMGGGLTILQISPGLSLEKIAYLATLVAATLFAARSIAKRWPAGRKIGAVPPLAAAGIVAALVTASALVANVNGITLQSWAIDIPSYGMLPVAVVLGIDLALSNHRPREVAALLFFAGLASAAGFTAAWTVAHGVAQLDLSRFIFTSFFLPAGAFCLALACAFDGRWTYRMASLAWLLLVAMLFTGTRIIFLFAIPVVVVLVVSRGRRRRRIAVLLVVGVLMVGLAVTILAVSGIASYINVDLLQTRLEGVVPLVTSFDFNSDQSLYLRYMQTRELQAAWNLHPWLGIGPGPLYSYAQTVEVKPVDSPLAIFARFGVIGAAVFAVFFLTLLRSRIRLRAHWVPATALLAFLCLIIAWSVVSSPLDDKGIPLALIPLLGLCGVWRTTDALAEITQADLPP